MWPLKLNWSKAKLIFDCVVAIISIHIFVYSTCENYENKIFQQLNFDDNIFVIWQKLGRRDISHIAPIEVMCFKFEMVTTLEMLQMSPAVISLWIIVVPFMKIMVHIINLLHLLFIVSVANFTLHELNFVTSKYKKWREYCLCTSWCCRI